MPTMRDVSIKTNKAIAFDFFYANAGYSYDPKKETADRGRARCARELAQAEAKASALGYYFEWCDDWDGCIGCECGSEDCDCCTGAEHECLVCQVYAPGNPNVLASLGGICKPSREYRRVIEAELASEALNS